MNQYQQLWSMENNVQDGAIYGDYLFRFNAEGLCKVYSIPEEKKIATFELGQLDVLVPHSNAVCFGTEYYEEGDEFPLMYSNIYNNYAKAEDRLEGVCLVYRLVRTEDSFAATLVQVIRVGFVEDLDLWKSLEGKGDVRPYGNFVVDTDQEKLYAFTMRDKYNTTRYFAFPLPKLADGVMDEVYGVPVVTLNKEDITAQFDCPYSQYVQGACYHKNKIYSVEGFSNDVNPPKMRVINLEKQCEEAIVDFYALGLKVEAEFVDFYKDQLYYSTNDGSLYWFPEF